MTDPAAAGATAASSPPLLRSHSDEFPRVGQRFQRDGAFVILLLEASFLHPMERLYGVEVYRRARGELAALAIDVVSAQFGPDDYVASRGVGADEIGVFVFRPRRDSGFYREGLPALAQSLEESLERQGARIVYPYSRETPFFPVGTAVALYNPTLRVQRQVRAALDAAREDAALSARVGLRQRRKRFLDLVLAEDVSVLYEPILDLASREVVGYEALVRGPWGGPLQAPLALFQRAEEMDLVFELDCLCRRKALQGARGLAAGRKLFLNCLPTAIHDPSFRGDALERLLDDLRIVPSDVVLEISEQESIENFEIFREARDYYRNLGFKIALDDTGVANAGFEAVLELAPDYLKLDRSLVRSVDSDPPRQELLRGLQPLAAALGARLVAEGVETSEELAMLHQLGIPYGQGFLLGRPAPLRKL
jgi:EAL domain-containing protein (putative c-di-GMP-specific phosphodiesterase class I)